MNDKVSTEDRVDERVETNDWRKKIERNQKRKKNKVDARVMI